MITDLLILLGTDRANLSHFLIVYNPVKFNHFKNTYGYLNTILLGTHQWNYSYSCHKIRDILSYARDQFGGGGV